MKMYLIYKNSSVFNNVNIMNRYRGNGLLSQHLIYRCWPFFRGKTYNFDCQIRGIHNNIVLLNSQQSQNNNLININSNNVLDDTRSVPFDGVKSLNDSLNLEQLNPSNELKFFKSIVNSKLEYLNLDDSVKNKLNDFDILLNNLIKNKVKLTQL